MTIDLTTYAQDSWRYNLDTYACRIGRGAYIPYRWHVYLAHRLVQAIFDGGARIIITAPPRHGKSFLASQWLSTWFLDTFPDRRVILASYGTKLARYWSQQIRDIFLRNKETWTEIHEDHALATDWWTTAGGGLMAVGVDSGTTGFGGNLIIGDDLHKDWAEAQSPTMRNKTYDWLQNTLLTRAEPDASVIIVQTRWHKRDVIGRLKDEEQGWTEIRFPALAEENDVLGRAVGEPLCPERYSAHVLQKIRTRNPLSFAGLYQQRPSDELGNIIKRDWIQFYKEKPEVTKVILSWDLNAGDETIAGSYVVGQVWGYSSPDYYLLDQVRGRWEYVETIRRFEAQVADWPTASGKYVEKKAAGAPLISQVRTKIPGVIPVTPKGSKQARLEAVAPLFESGNVYIPHPSLADWSPEYVEELVSFPTGEADDQVDATTQALNALNGTQVADIMLPDTGTRTSPWAF